MVEEARESIAARVGAHPSELIFTSGGTESDNLAVKGGYWAQAAGGRTELVASAVEHHAVFESVGLAGSDSGRDRRTGCRSTRQAGSRRSTSRPPSATRTALVSVMWANNEVGTLQPVATVAARAGEHGALSHSDAVQAVGHLPVDFAASGLDLMTFTAHKLGGPYGIGALLARREVDLTAVQHGGGQERDVRSGTLTSPPWPGSPPPSRSRSTRPRAARRRGSGRCARRWSTASAAAVRRRGASTARSTRPTGCLGWPSSASRAARPMPC